MFNKLSKTTIDKITVGKILLIVGILFLTVSLLGVRGLSGLPGGEFLAVSIGWYLTILGAFLISLRIAAWTSLLVGLYMFFSVKVFKVFTGFYFGTTIMIFNILLIASFSVFLGLILGIISFLKKKK